MRWMARTNLRSSRLLDRLPGSDKCKPDAYPVYEWPPPRRHVTGKGGAVNRIEGIDF